MRITKITLKSFLVSFLGILTAEVGFSDDRQNGFYDECSNVREGEICYLFVSHGETNWNTAHDKCQNKNLSLPIIRNIEEQAALETYLRELKQKNQSITAVWTSGKRNIWTWLNNKTMSSTTITISNHDSVMETHMRIYGQKTGTGGTGFILRPENPVNSAWFLCQYKGRQCSGQYEFNATNGCLIPSGNGNVNWYGARNECLSKGGDLAILTYQDLQNLKNHEFPNYNYWIGLRRVPHWVWIATNISKALEEEVKYTHWTKEEMPTDGGELCLSIAANDGQWRASQCNHTVLSVVCEKQAPTTTDSTSRKSTAATTARNSHTTTVTRADTTNNHNDESSITAYAAIGAGVVIVILCIIVILVVIWRKSKSSNNKTEPAEMDSKNTNDSNDKKTKENKSSKTTEERSIYADIPLTEKTANDAPEASQKGTVYASLDFNQGVTYAEPSTLYTNTQNASGPIYAEPLNATGNGSTSAGSSPAIKIGPMGDVYALPTTNSTPSDAKMTERPIYANT